MDQHRELLKTGLTRRAAILLGVAAIAPAIVPGVAAAQDQDARPLLDQTATAMAAVQSFHFAMTTPQGKSSITDQFELSGFEGDVQRPDRFRVSFTAKASILSLTIKVIGIG